MGSMVGNMAIRHTHPSGDLHFGLDQTMDLVNHVVLPPRLPHEKDRDPTAIENDMLKLAQEVARAYIQTVNAATQVAWKPVLDMLYDWVAIKQDSDLRDEVLKAKLAGMQPNGCLALHLAAQNAGIMIIREGSSVAFECFEASPTSSSVMSTQGRLLRTFPGCRVTCQADHLSNEYFRRELAVNIRRLNNEAIGLCTASTFKAGSIVTEERDTTNPALVVDYLMTMLSALGQAEDFVAIQKRTRDDVLWENARLPWRRSPFWLVLKLAVQRALVSSFPKREAQKQYKVFIALLIARTLDLCLKIELPSDVIAVTHVKLARRVHKYEAIFGDTDLPGITAISNRAKQSVRDAWLQEQKRHHTSVSPLPMGDWEDATSLQIPQIRSYLNIALGPAAKVPRTTAFVPEPRLRISQDPTRLPTLKGHKKNASSVYDVLLVDTELWVETHLSSWTLLQVNGLSSATACYDLVDLLQDYWCLAAAHYVSSPVEQSEALLVVFELWVALDKICLAKIDMMCNYPPEIPPAILAPLLLPKLKDMRRLHAIEAYLNIRMIHSSSRVNGVFEDPQRGSFSVRYYESSPEQQKLRATIEQEDVARRQEKSEEWTEKAKKYQEIIDEAEKLVCETERDEDGRKHDATNCARCKLLRMARAITVVVDEKSLPEDDMQAKAAVFELAVPPEFAAWRDAICVILHDIGKRNCWNQHWPKRVTISEYKQLSKHVQKGHRPTRVTLASSSKLFHASHYRDTHFPVALESLFLNNGLRYNVWDGSSHRWVKRPASDPCLKSYCTLSLPEGPYSDLGWASRSSSHSFNLVMAKQSKCHPDLRMGEYVTFAGIRSGENIQSINILRELRRSDLRQNELAVNILFLQAAWEAGSSNGDALRLSHAEFHNPAFCRQLLSILQGLLKTIEGSWKEQHSMSTIIQLALRLLSLTKDVRDVSMGCLKLIRRARAVTLRWCHELQKDLHSTSSRGTGKHSSSVLLLSSAILCFSTVDVEKKHLKYLLNSAADLAVLTESHMIIHDNTPERRTDLSLVLQQGLTRRLKIAHKVEQYIRPMLEDHTPLAHNGLNQAIRAMWHNARLRTAWQFCQGSWVQTVMFTANDGECQTVHYNLLSGALLVDSIPLGKLPESYAKHVHFQEVFGRAVLSVVASDMPGMLYRVREPIEGNEVHIGTRGIDVVIKARNRGRVFQAIPSRMFGKDLPPYFITSFAHWVDENTGDLEFRPLDTKWQPSSSTWKLKFSNLNFADAKVVMRSNNKRLVDESSILGRAVATILESLETSPYIHITLSDSPSAELEIDLHRYNLHFVATANGDLKSVEYNAVIDPDQNIGTLVGLRTKLVLRDLDCTVDYYERSVLTPYGTVSFEKEKNHVLVTIGGAKSDKQPYFIYKLDRQLQKVCSPQDILGSLHKAHLHAITSFSLPDPFTQRTGTEEALSVLQAASVYSSSPLGQDAFNTLEAIARLTPDRKFYPQHKRCMQNVSWDPNLSPLSQRDEYYPIVEDILNHNNKLAMLRPGAAKPRTLSGRGDRSLLQRALRRNSTLSRDGVVCNAVDDVVYSSRDQFKRNDRAQQTYDIALLIRDWPGQVSTHSDLKAVLKGWLTVSGYGDAFGVPSLQELTHFNLPKNWGSLYNLCRSASRESTTFKLMFAFCAIAFGSGSSTIPHLRTLLAFAFSGAFRTTNPPQSHSIYRLEVGWQPTEEAIEEAIQGCLSDNSTRERKLLEKERQAAPHVQALRDYIYQQWPATTVLMPWTIPDCIDTVAAVQRCQTLFDEWHTNRAFLTHVDEVQKKLDNVQAELIAVDLPELSNPSVVDDHCPFQEIDLKALLQEPGRAENITLLPRPESLTVPVATCLPNPQNLSQLEDLVHKFDHGMHQSRKDYGAALKRSLNALQSQPSTPNDQASLHNAESLISHYHAVSRHTDELTGSIRNALAPSSMGQSLLEAANMWPRTTTERLLSHLSPAKIDSLSAPWKAILVALGESIAQLQRSRRLLKLSKGSDIRALFKELESPGRQDWTAAEYPGWLLLEIENNITIRATQAKVAREMIMPSVGGNSVLQLNMGEGKSSVILPMVVSALADGKRLVRVVVLKSLLRHTEQLLCHRLGGFLNQRIYHTPFSRKTKLDDKIVENLASIFSEAKDNRGVLVTLPDHMLSFRLMGREKICSDPQLASRLLNVERWLQNNCRDVLDESDEILDPRFQLVYTVGEQHMLEGQPDRWLIAQALLSRVHIHAENLAALYPNELELEWRNNAKSFPFLSFLRSEVGDRLNQLLVQDFLDGRLMGLSFDSCSSKTKEAIGRFIRNRSVSDMDCATITDAIDCPRRHKILLVLRGLIAHGILDFTLQRKRWLVEYGLDPSRSLMAVPYRAKGVPSLSSEYGHPEVAILLTCLSYYYTGLTPDQIRSCLVMLAQDANADDVYTSWTQACEDFPTSLMSFNAINLEDDTLCMSVLFPKLQFNAPVANFYLTKVVFPREGMEFAKRISASAWDIPSASDSSELVTTGFSGTNDSRDMLPFSIIQRDLQGLHHTNAMVLDLLLRDENKKYVYAGTADSKQLSVSGLLALISREQPHVSVLIDVGAQVLEATNYQVAEEWLKHVADALASVYFDDDDEAMVLDRNGLIYPLRISPFRVRLDTCLIYLDQVHTRGIDLPIPTGAHAAVTLGPRLVKDRLAQACLRMRKLGNGHSLCFISPPQVHQSIRDHKKENTAEITSKDVVFWTMEQSCLAMDVARPLRLVQGLEFASRQRACNKLLPAELSPEDIVSDETRTQDFWNAIQEADAHSLHHMYGAHNDRVNDLTSLIERNSVSSTMQHLVQEFDATGDLAIENPSMDNEQEREREHELEFQIEREQQIQRPAHVEEIMPEIGGRLRKFIKTGILTGGASDEIMLAFQFFMETSASSHTWDTKIYRKMPQLFITKDFARSVKLSPDDKLDGYLKPVNWVLTSIESDIALIISPFEASALLSDVKVSKKVCLHVFAPKTNKKDVSFDSMDFYNISAVKENHRPSPEVVRSLNLFAGTLYLNSMAEYESLCHFLGVVTSDRQPKGNKQVGWDKFAEPTVRSEIGWPEHCPFDYSPLYFLRQVLSLRMHGQNYHRTHLGSLVEGGAVHEDAFEDAFEDCVESASKSENNEAPG